MEKVRGYVGTKNMNLVHRFAVAAFNVKHGAHIPWRRAAETPRASSRQGPPAAAHVAREESCTAPISPVKPRRDMKLSKPDGT